MLDGAVGAAPAKSRAGKGFPKPYFNAEILRLRKERVHVLVEIKVLEREGGDTSDLWAEFRALRAKAKRESRRAKAAYWKSRNQTLAELARDPTRAKQFWNVLLQRAASHCDPGCCMSVAKTRIVSKRRQTLRRSQICSEMSTPRSVPIVYRRAIVLTSPRARVRTPLWPRFWSYRNLRARRAIV